MIVLRAALEATQRHGAEQRRLVAVLAQEIRRIHGPNIPDEIALPMNAMIKGAEAIRATMLEQIAALDTCERRLQEHDPENGGNLTYRLLPDPETESA